MSHLSLDTPMWGRPVMRAVRLYRENQLFLKKQEKQFKTLSQNLGHAKLLQNVNNFDVRKTLKFTDWVRFITHRVTGPLSQFFLSKMMSQNEIQKRVFCHHFRRIFLRKPENRTEIFRSLVWIPAATLCNSTTTVVVTETCPTMLGFRSNPNLWMWLLWHNCWQLQ